MHVYRAARRWNKVYALSFVRNAPNFRKSSIRILSWTASTYTLFSPWSLARSNLPARRPENKGRGKSRPKCEVLIKLLYALLRATAASYFPSLGADRPTTRGRRGVGERERKRERERVSSTALLSSLYTYCILLRRRREKSLGSSKQQQQMAVSGRAQTDQNELLACELPVNDKYT